MCREILKLHQRDANQVYACWQSFAHVPKDYRVELSQSFNSCSKWQQQGMVVSAGKRVVGGEVADLAVALAQP